jgi:hypothetical protein
MAEDCLMHLPQVTVLLIYAAQLAITFRYHATPIVQDYRVTTAHVVVMLALLTWGGFFGGAQ